MPDYPINLNVSDRRCVVIGGGAVAVRKVRALLDAGADVLVVAPEIRPEIDNESAAGRLRTERAAYDASHLDDAFIAVAATGDREVNRAVARDARTRGILVNVVDDPGAGTFTAPAVARGRHWTVAVSTGAASPALARRLRQHIEADWGASLDVILGWLGESRRNRTIPGATQRDRAAAIERVIDDGRILEALRAGDTAGARRLFESAMVGDVGP
jgi:siroheme synthase-like protein